MGTRKVKISIRTPDPDSPLAIKDYNTDTPDQSAAYWVGGYGALSPARVTATEDIGNIGTRTTLYEIDGSQVCGEFGFDELEVWIDGLDVTGNYGSFEAVFAAIGKYIFAQNVGLLQLSALEDINTKLDALNAALASNGSDSLQVTVLP
jgi:hypothetical protein